MRRLVQTAHELSQAMLVISGSYGAVGRSGKIILGLGTVAAAVALVLVTAILIGQGVQDASLWATVLGLPIGLVAAFAGLWAVVGRPARIVMPAELDVPDWVVDRPAEAAQVVGALLRHGAGTVSITTALQGAGGFGKTTLARVVCADRRVRHRFNGGVYLVTVGRDARGAAAMATKLNDVIKLVSGEDATFTDPEIAGRRLAALLDTGPRRLLVLDDVWEPRQLAPFVAGGRRCARLVTTRDPGLLTGRGIAVRVDQMSLEQARALLASGLAHLDSSVADELLAVTGRWPLLLGLVNKILVNARRAGNDVDAAGNMLLQRLYAAGPAVVDHILGEAGQPLDVGQPDERARAVQATIDASTSLLAPEDRQRFFELGVFAEDEVIPFGLLARLWQATADLDQLQVSQVCAHLTELGLASAAGSGRGITLHDVIRDFLRYDLGQQRLAKLNDVLVNAAADGLPATDHRGKAGAGLDSVAWWAMAPSDHYMWDHLIEHLIGAGRHREAENVASDLRWVGARLEEAGPAAPTADLSLIGTPRATRQRTALARAAHLLAPTEPAAAVVDVLHSRVAANDPEWAAQVDALRNAYRRPRLVNRWRPPDLPDPSLRRVLTGHGDAVPAVAVAPDGSWLATGSSDGTVRIWDPATGQERVTLAGHRGPVNAIAVAPDGSWLATGSSDGTVRIWDTKTGRKRITAANRCGIVDDLAITADGRWLIFIADIKTIRIHEALNGRHRVTLTNYAGPITAIAVMPNGQWLAAGSIQGAIRIWDIPGRRVRATLWGHTGMVAAVTFAHDGNWLFTGSSDGTVRAWNPVRGVERATLATDLGSVSAVAISPDGSWLAAGSSNGTVRILDTATGQERGTLTGHLEAVNAIAAAPDSSWLATGSSDGTVRIWDSASNQTPAAVTGHRGDVKAIAVAPDGNWLATETNRAIQIWDTSTGKERPFPWRSSGLRSAMKVAPDGRWLATQSETGLSFWDVNTGHEARLPRSMPGKTTVSAAAFTPDGKWLVAGVRDRAVIVWDSETRRERASRPLRLTRHARRTRRELYILAIAPDGRWVATDSMKNEILVWDTATLRVRAALQQKKMPDLVVPARDGSWLATSTNGTVSVWDTGTWTSLATLSHRGSVTSMASADGRWLAIGTSQGAVWIWNARTAQEQAAAGSHRGGVCAMAVAPDGNWIATCGDDRTVRVWNVITGQAESLIRVENIVSNCAWLGGGGLAVGGRAGLYLFDFLPQRPPTERPPATERARS